MKLIALLDEKNYTKRSGIVREAVRAIIFNNGKVALVKSLKENHYKFPGGGIEKGESHIDTLIRETKEETGLIIKSDSIKECGFIHEVRKSIYSNEAFEQISYFYFAQVEDDVVVNLDVDNVLCLENKSGKLIIKSGCLEDEENKIISFVETNMDGGKQAIERRLKFYAENNLNNI